MKLVGSKTEKEFRAQLLQSHEALFGEDNSVLLSAVRKIHPNLVTAYVIDWIPEQAEDIYRALVDNRYLIEVEVDRTSKSVTSVRPLDLVNYERELSQVNRIKLAVARELSSHDIAKT